MLPHLDSLVGDMLPVVVEHQTLDNLVVDMQLAMPDDEIYNSAQDSLSSILTAATVHNNLGLAFCALLSKKVHNAYFTAIKSFSYYFNTGDLIDGLSEWRVLTYPQLLKTKTTLKCKYVKYCPIHDISSEL